MCDARFWLWYRPLQQRDRSLGASWRSQEPSSGSHTFISEAVSVGAVVQPSWSPKLYISNLNNIPLIAVQPHLRLGGQYLSSLMMKTSTLLWILAGSCAHISNFRKIYERHILRHTPQSWWSHYCDQTPPANNLMMMYLTGTIPQHVWC